jgi:hypothetical protein
MGLITGKVAAIITDTRIVINRGKMQGVTDGMRFVVKLKIPEIVDPENEYNKLTGIYFEKGSAKVVTVFDSMAFADLEGKSVSNYAFVGPTTIVYPRVGDNMLITDYDWKIMVGDEVEQVE